MKMKSFIVNWYNKIQNFLSLRNITWMALIVFVLMLLPICYLSFVNRASGDDYGFGVYCRIAFVNTHSLLEVWNGIVRIIKEVYSGWQGTWFSIFLFAIHPEVFSDKAYVVTTFIMLFLWIGSTIVLFKEILVRQMLLNKNSVWIIILLFLIISIQYVPSTKSSLFWYNGCAHYLVPFAMGQFLIFLLLRFIDMYKMKFYFWICVFMALLGGSNYQAALFALIVAVYVGIMNYVKEKDKHILLLLLPIVLELIGLIISIKAPGNKVRAGEDFGLSFSKAIETIGFSFIKNFMEIGDYFQEKPIMIIGLFVLFMILLEVFKQSERRKKISYPIIRVLALICLQSAMQAPEIYAGVEVSRGVENMNYWIFLLTVLGIMLILADSITKKIQASDKMLHKCLVIPGLVVCIILIILVKGNLKDSTTYVCLRYIVSGEAAAYKEQMDLQTRLLIEDKTGNVILPFINDVQGPLMHMPVTSNSEAWTNKVTGNFYEKESIVAMPRPEWNELYGDS